MSDGTLPHTPQTEPPAIPQSNKNGWRRLWISAAALVTGAIVFVGFAPEGFFGIKKTDKPTRSAGQTIIKKKIPFNELKKPVPTETPPKADPQVQAQQIREKTFYDLAPYAVHKKLAAMLENDPAALGGEMNTKNFYNYTRKERVDVAVPEPSAGVMLETCLLAKSAMASKLNGALEERQLVSKRNEKTSQRWSHDAPERRTIFLVRVRPFGLGENIDPATPKIAYVQDWGNEHQNASSLSDDGVALYLVGKDKDDKPFIFGLTTKNEDLRKNNSSVAGMSLLYWQHWKACDVALGQDNLLNDKKFAEHYRQFLEKWKHPDVTLEAQPPKTNAEPKKPQEKKDPQRVPVNKKLIQALKVENHPRSQAFLPQKAFGKPYLARKNLG